MKTTKQNQYQKTVAYLDTIQKEINLLEGAGYDALITFRIELRIKGYSITHSDLKDLLEYRYNVTWRPNPYNPPQNRPQQKTITISPE